MKKFFAFTDSLAFGIAFHLPKWHRYLEVQLPFLSLVFEFSAPVAPPIPNGRDRLTPFEADLRDLQLHRAEYVDVLMRVQGRNVRKPAEWLRELEAATEGARSDG